MIGLGQIGLAVARLLTGATVVYSDPDPVAADKLGLILLGSNT